MSPVRFGWARVRATPPMQQLRLTLPNGFATETRRSSIIHPVKTADRGRADAPKARCGFRHTRRAGSAKRPNAQQSRRRGKTGGQRQQDAHALADRAMPPRAGVVYVCHKVGARQAKERDQAKRQQQRCPSVPAAIWLHGLPSPPRPKGEGCFAANPRAVRAAHETPHPLCLSMRCVPGGTLQLSICRRTARCQLCVPKYTIMSHRRPCGALGTEHSGELSV